MKIDRHLFHLISSTLLSTVLIMASSFLLARLLSVEDRGLLLLFVASVTYVATLAVGGLGFALTLSMRQQQYLHWQRYFVLFLAYSLLVSCIASFFIDIQGFSLLFIVNVCLTTIFNFTLEKSKIEADMRLYRLLVIQQPFCTVLFYGLCYSLFGEQSLANVIRILTFITAVQALFCLYYLHGLARSFHRQYPHQLTPINAKFFFSTWLKQNLFQTFGATVTNIDKFLIAFLMGNYVLGLYAVCLAFDALITRFMNSLTDYYYSGLLNGLNRLKAVLGIILLLTIAAIIFVPWLAEPIIRFFFSARYIEVASFLLLFIINAILAGLSWLLSQNMLILGKQFALLIRQLISLVVLCGLFYYFRQQGLLGVAYALIGASLTRLCISMIYYYRYPVQDKCGLK